MSTEPKSPPSSLPAAALRRRCLVSAGAVAALIVITTLGLWRISVRLQGYKLDESVRLHAQQTMEQLVSFLNARLLMLRSIARFCAQTAETVREADFQAFVAATLADTPGIAAVVLTEPDRRARWLAPTGAMAWNDYYALAGDPRLAQAFDLALTLRQPALSDALEIPRLGAGFVAVTPLMVGQRHMGFLVGIFEYQSLLSYLLQPVLVFGGQVSIHHSGRLVYPPLDLAPAARATRTAGERGAAVRRELIGGREWNVRVQPSRAAAPSPFDFASATILGLGTMLAAVSGVTVYRSQWRALRLQSEAHDSRRRLESADRSLLEIKAELDLILNNVDEGIVIYDAALEPVQANAAFLTMFDLTESALATHRGAIHHEYMIQWLGSETKYWSLFNTLRHHPEQSYTDELERVTRVGGRPERRIYRRSAMTLLGAEGEWRGVAVVYKDMTTVKAIDRVKEEFLANVTHELRTPLASIVGFAQTLLREPQMPVETRQEFLSILSEEAARLHQLIEDLLDLRRMEARGFAPKPTSYDLKVLVDDLVRSSRAMLLPRNLKVRVVWAGPGNSRLQGEVAQIGRALRNLLVNAVKYSPDGGEIVIAGYCGRRQIALEVTDQGRGIDDRDLPHIFDKFYRGTGTSAKGRPSGTGLGLAIVKHIVESHGGHLGVRSVVGQGTTVRIELPRELPSAARPDAVAAESAADLVAMAADPSTTDATPFDDAPAPADSAEGPIFPPRHG